VRYLPGGLPDASFGNSGIIVTAVSTSFDEGLAVTLQPDGKIVAGGYATGNGSSDFAVIRYLPNGMLDAGFGQAAIGRIILAYGAPLTVGQVRTPFQAVRVVLHECFGRQLI